MAKADEQQPSQAEVVQEFILKESRTEFDAAHPRFVKPEELEVVQKFQTEHDFYCEQCEMFFAPTVVALNLHFRSDIAEHRPYGRCFYCKGPVYEYKVNRETQLYHKCVVRNK